MLEVEACHQLMTAHEVGHVVSNRSGLVAHAVAWCTELIAQCDVRLGRPRCIGLIDVNEGEVRRITIAHIVDIRIGEQQLIGEVLREAAAQVT